MHYSYVGIFFRSRINHGDLVFFRTKSNADRINDFLEKNAILVETIHGDKSQSSRQRALTYFKAGKLKVLVATDIAARGIDVDGLTHVFNFDLPNVPETYVHRIGRTGRAGAEGRALSFCDRDEFPYLKDIRKLTEQQIPVVETHPFVLHFNHQQEQPRNPQQAQRNPAGKRIFGNRNQAGGQHRKTPQDF